MNKAVFLDRDGTINVEKHYLHKIEDFIFLPGVINGLHLLQEAGFMLVIITNQSGIARGYYTENDFHVLNDWMINQLKKNDVHIAKVYYCPHLPDAPVKHYAKDCNCRKPHIGMFLRAIEELGIDVDKSYAIGDKLRDLSICKSTKCVGYLVSNNENKEFESILKRGSINNIHYRNSFIECCKEIIHKDSMNQGLL